MLWYAIKGHVFPKRIRLLSPANLDVHHVKTDAGAGTGVAVSGDPDADASLVLTYIWCCC
jgi:hypothetical protein